MNERCEGLLTDVLYAIGQLERAALAGLGEIGGDCVGRALDALRRVQGGLEEVAEAHAELVMEGWTVGQILEREG